MAKYVPRCSPDNHGHGVAMGPSIWAKHSVVPDIENYDEEEEDEVILESEKEAARRA